MLDDVKRPQWFTIKDASAYLAVGEPTLYRWMREGRITYRKVGDSTRFLQEDLDALVEIHPSERDTPRAREYCPACHHDELVEGQIRSTGLLYFHPRHTRFWTLQDSNVPVRARMCTRCGTIAQFGDTEKLSMLLAAPETPAATSDEDAGGEVEPQAEQ